MIDGICRICLSNETHYDIFEVNNDNQEGEVEKCFSEIFYFCLNIDVSSDHTLSTKLCLKCYQTILSFYEFKMLALKSDSFLKSLEKDVNHDKNQNLLANNEDIKKEDTSLETIVYGEYLTEVSFVKEEKHLQYSSSEDEILSIVKQSKLQSLKGSNVPLKKKRGRHKNTTVLLPRVCEECGKCVKNIKEHMYLHSNLEDKKRYQCKLCEKMFCTLSSRSRHFRIKHLGVKKICTICNKAVVHLQSHHLLKHDYESLPFGCSSCDQRFLNRSSLETHMITHTKERPFSCAHCDKMFRSKHVMMLHVRQVHEKERSHLCQFCSKSFFKKYHLQVHLRSHTKEKPYECKICGKFYSSSTSLKEHKLTHCDVKRFACTLCDKKFAKAGNLRLHMVSHTRVRNHVCSYCGVGFGRSDHRRRHERTAHLHSLIK